MDRQAHLRAARSLAAWATTLHTEGEYLGAGELIWGATVHAVSAADPEHEAQFSDRYSNPHQAPNTKATFTAAARRIIGSPFTEDQIAQCLNIGQRELHNHFYHLTNSEQNLRRNSAVGAIYVQQLLHSAEQSWQHTTPKQNRRRQFNSEHRIHYRRRGICPRRRSAF